MLRGRSLIPIGEPTVVDELFTSIQQHLLLRPTRDRTVSNTVNFLGRNVTNKGDYYEICLSDKYTTDLLYEAGMANSKPAPATGTKDKGQQHRPGPATQRRGTQSIPMGSRQTTVDDLHQTRRQLGNKGASKILNRANNSRSTEAEPSTKIHQRHIALQDYYKVYIRPTDKTTDITPDVGVYVDSDWGCATKRKSTTGFVIKVMGATIHVGSRTQPTIALSSAEAELYAINTGATEALHYTSEASWRKHSTRRKSTFELFNWKKHGNTDWVIKESEAHRVETSLYPTIGAQRRRANPQDQHGGESRRHLHQVRCTETQPRHFNEVGTNTQPYCHEHSHNKHNSFTWLRPAICAMDLVGTSTWSMSTWSLHTINYFPGTLRIQGQTQNQWVWGHFPQRFSLHSLTRLDPPWGLRTMGLKLFYQPPVLRHQMVHTLRLKSAKKGNKNLTSCKSVSSNS